MLCIVCGKPERQQKCDIFSYNENRLYLDIERHLNICQSSISHSQLHEKSLLEEFDAKNTKLKIHRFHEHFIFFRHGFLVSRHYHWGSRNFLPYTWTKIWRICSCIIEASQGKSLVAEAQDSNAKGLLAWQNIHIHSSFPLGSMYIHVWYIPTKHACRPHRV